MAGSLIWLAIYLTAGIFVLWACYNTGTCLVRSRLNRNAQILSALGARPTGGDRSAPLPAAHP